MGDPGAASRRKNRLPKGGSESSDLHAAARNGDLTTVESICNANPLAVNARDRHSRTPSTDSESKPEGRQARKQRKMEAIQARLIVPLPPTVTSLEQTVSAMQRNTSWRGVALSDRSAEETTGATREEIANENRGSGEVLVSNTGESSEDLCFDRSHQSPAYGFRPATIRLDGERRSGLRREALGAERSAVRGKHQEEERFRVSTFSGR
ncbi:uncharacterized protein LOC135653251 isoform X2 [Musa acuminata AAA Group]|uniref:uncharacterized protein LOC135653251 isoform X2 n=1 Tax=Musa acuminata AAA Group TaxID=214697 RepID=UPI0031DE3901